MLGLLAPVLQQLIYLWLYAQHDDQLDAQACAWGPLSAYEVEPCLLASWQGSAHHAGVRRPGESPAASASAPGPADSWSRQLLLASKARGLGPGIRVHHLPGHHHYKGAASKALDVRPCRPKEVHKFRVVCPLHSAALDRGLVEHVAVADAVADAIGIGCRLLRAGRGRTALLAHVLCASGCWGAVRGGLRAGDQIAGRAHVCAPQRGPTPNMCVLCACCVPATAPSKSRTQVAHLSTGAPASSSAPSSCSSCHSQPCAARLGCEHLVTAQGHRQAMPPCPMTPQRTKQVRSLPSVDC